MDEAKKGFWRLLDPDEMVERSDEFLDRETFQWDTFDNDTDDEEFEVAGHPDWESNVFRRWVPTP